MAKPMATKLDGMNSPINKLSIIRPINQTMIDELQEMNNSTEVYGDAEIEAALFVATDLNKALLKAFNL